MAGIFGFEDEECFQVFNFACTGKLNKMENEFNIHGKIALQYCYWISSILQFNCIATNFFGMLGIA